MPVTSQQMVSTRPRMVRSASRPEPSAEADTAGEADNELQCGKGFKDSRGVINCNGCGIRCESGAEFVEHANKQVQQRGTQNKVETKKVDYSLSIGSGVRDSTKVVDQCLGGEGDGPVKQMRYGGKVGVVDHLAGKERMRGASALAPVIHYSAKPVTNTGKMSYPAIDDQRPITGEYMPTVTHQIENNTSDFPSLAKTILQQPCRVINSSQNTSMRNSASQHSSMMSSVSKIPSMMNNAPPHLSMVNNAPQPHSIVSNAPCHPSMVNNAPHHPSMVNNAPRHLSMMNNAPQHPIMMNSTFHPSMLNNVHQNPSLKNAPNHLDNAPHHSSMMNNTPQHPSMKMSNAAQHPSLVSGAPQPSEIVSDAQQQLFQQQLSRQQQLAFQQQQQLLVMKQQEQQLASFPHLQQQLPATQMMPERDRQIALLEQELRVQKMMQEVERREAMVREQAILLTVQADRIEMQQNQMTSYDLMARDPVLQSGAPVAREREREEVALECPEKNKLDRMFEQMEKARKAELDKAIACKEAVKPGVETGQRASCTEGLAKLGEMVSRSRGIEGSARQVTGNFANEGISDTAREQFKILEDIKARNVEILKSEEMSIQLISKLSLVEEEEVLEGEPSDTVHATNNSWPDLSDAGAVGAGREAGRLKVLSQKNPSGQDKAEGSGKPGKKEIKKIAKRIRETNKMEVMAELEMERRKAGHELKERMAAQEREQFSKIVAAEEERRVLGKKRNKSGK